jgi:hypothetical protein
MTELQWLGLTIAEAQALAAREKLECEFIYTQDPKQDTAGLTGRIIRAQRKGTQLRLVVGYMIPGIV